MTPHNTSQEELLKELQTSAAGLSSQEARQRLERYGENKLAEKRKKTNLQRFLDQFKDVMILILLLAAAVSFVVACFGHDPMEFFEPLLILLIVVLNAVLGMVQEAKAEKALDALKSMSAPHARVLRDGKEQVIDAAQLVPGDVIRLEAGDFIPADARLLKSVSLKSEESALTGESVPSEKDAAALVEEKAPLGDRSNMVFSGCSVTYGTATAVVTGTGMNTEMGKIAGLLEGEEEGQTPLQQKLAGLEQTLPAALQSQAAAIALCAVILLAAFFGFGGAKLKAKASEAAQWYTAGVSADGGYSLNDELTTRANTAANIITTGSNTLGADNAEVLAAQDALTVFQNDLDGVNAGKTRLHALYEDDAALGAAIDQLYAKLQEQAADPMKMGAVQGQYGQFNSAATIIGNLTYNEQVSEYQKDTGGFPASVLKSLFGVKEVEPFA